MRKIILLLIGTLIFSACLDSETNDSAFAYRLLPIDEYQVPTSFTFNEIDTVTVKYTLPNGCYSFDRLYYEPQDTIRLIAVSAFVEFLENCTEVTTQEEFKFAIKANQQEDYVLRFFKGVDDDGKNIFEDVIVPVN